MNKHARKIWHSWADGIPVQFKASDDEGWKNAEPPAIIDPKQPQNEPRLWRVKPPPRRLTVRYRVFLMKSGGSILPMIHERDGKHETDASMESFDDFVCWDGPERVTQVEVED